MITSQVSQLTFSGNGSTSTPYALADLRFDENAWITVDKIHKTTGAKTELTQGVDYTVTGTGSTSSASVVTGAGAVSSDYWVRVSRNAPRIQATNLIATGAIPSAVLEKRLDWLVMALIDEKRREESGSASALRVPDGETVSTLTKALRSGKFIGFDDEGALEFKTAIEILAATDGELAADIEAAVQAASDAEASATAAAASADEAAANSAGFAGFKDESGTSYTAVQSDRLKRLRMSNVGAITFDLPDNLTEPFACEVEVTGGGTVNFTASGARNVTGILSFTAGVVSIALNGSTFEVAGGGEVNTISSVGSGTSLVEGKSGVDLRVRSISVFGGFSLVEASTVKLLMRSQLHAYTLAHIDAYAITGMGMVLVLDDIFRGLAGQASSNSLRGTAWTTLSGDLVPSLVTGHIFLTEASAGSGSTVACLKNSKPGTIVGGATRGSTGLALDGATQYVTLPSRVLNNGEQWTCIVGVINAASQGNETFFAQNDGNPNRHTFAYQENTGSPANQVGAFVQDNAGPASYTVYTGASEVSASQRMFATRQVTTTIKAYKDGSATAANTVSKTPNATVVNAIATYGATAAGSNKFGGTLLFGLFFNAAIPEADMPLIKTLFNNAIDQLNLA